MADASQPMPLTKFCRKSKVWAIGLERDAPIVDKLGEFVEGN